MKLNYKISTLIFLICFIFNNSYSQQNTNGWYWINGQPQGNSLNWSKIIDATHYYAVGESGTFMKSTDAGDTWLINSQAGVLDPSFGSGGTLRLYSAWFFDANTGIVVGQSVNNDGGKIRRTTDGGQTFTDIALGIPSGFARVFDIVFINSTTGYLCGNNNVKAMKTTDAGLSWQLLPNLPGATIDYNCVYAKDANNIFLGAATDGQPNTRRIVRTTNGGATWNIDVLPGSTIVDVKDIEFQNANTGFVCGNSVSGNPSYFAYTINGGASWTEAVFPNKEHGLYDLQIIGSTPYVLGGNYNHYYYTSNLGVTWDSVFYGDPSNPYQPYDGLVYSFDFNGSDAIVAGGNGKINISNDGGASWRNKNYAVGNSTYCFSSIFALRGTQKVWAGSNGGASILYSTNSGTNWTKSQLSSDFGVSDIQMQNSSTGYAVGGSLFFGTGYCYKTVNGGVNWTSLTIPTPATPLYSVDFVNVNTGWIVGGYPFGSPTVISKTTNGGSTWTSQAPTPAYNNVMSDIDMFDANIGYCVSGTNVWKTINGGNNWNLITVTPSNSWNRVKVFTATTLYLGGQDKINKSTDGGATWSTVTISAPNIFNMDWFDMNNGIVVGTAGYTAKTKDGGLTWKERNPGSSTLTGVSMASVDTVYAACDRNVWGALFRLYDDHPVTFNLTIGIEGMWSGSTQVSDAVQCHLRNSVSPYNEVAVASSVTDNLGNAAFTFSTAPAGSYYLVITQRNSIETWSKLPQTIAPDGNYNYNFTTAATQAFGNNLMLNNGRYCNFSGDLNQDGFIDLLDVNLAFNDASSYATGYVVTDVNGDTFTDLSDLIIVFNNSSNFVQKLTP